MPKSSTATTTPCNDPIHDGARPAFQAGTRLNREGVESAADASVDTSPICDLCASRGVAFGRVYLGVNRRKKIAEQAARHRG